MSKLNSPDNATLLEPNVSSGRKLKRQQARGRKMVATSQLRGAQGARKGPPGRAKKRTMSGAPKREPKVDEQKKPYEMAPLEKDRVVARCAQKRGRGRASGFRMSEEHRTKIKNSRLLKVLIDHVEGRAEISPARVTAALGLLKKVLPDLQSVTVAGDPETPLVHEVHRIERIVIDVVDPKAGC